MPKQSVKPTFTTRYGRCLFGRWSVANTIEWRTPNSIVDPGAGYVKPHYRTQITKRNSLLKLAFFCMVRLKCHRKQPSKDNNDDNQKLNTLRHFDTPKGRGRMILRAELCVLLTERFWETPLPPRGSVLATAMAAWRTFPREPGAEGLVLAQTCPFARWYFSRPATKAVWDASDPKRTSIGPPNCLTVQTLEVACIGCHSRLRNGRGSPRREAQPTIWKRSDSGGLAQSWSAPLIAIVRCGLALQAS